ncbi:glycosyltransferase [Labrys sp. KNU-23]|uniref:glycosyltransferase n=1 Tax=Labrys sp. KNU-23 TaxID=2789216 RepID=UPI0011EE85EB|nr:glycosyltransferase [Labrys sp. KNU-23]QEN87460.1 glycosyltransferase [Labrys sp. KNU-23]
MISVVIAANGQEVALAETLAALVPAAADGFVREVVVAEAGPSRGTRLVADAVGCVIVDGNERAGLEAARSDWVLVMAPGVRLETDWFREAGVMMQRLQRAGERPVAMLFRAAIDDYGWRARTREILLKLSRRRRRRQAVLAPRRALLAEARLGFHALRARAFTGGAGTGS